MKTVIMKKLLVLCIAGAALFCSCDKEADGIKVIDIGNAYEERTPVMASE